MSAQVAPMDRRRPEPDAWVISESRRAPLRAWTVPSLATGAPPCLQWVRGHVWTAIRGGQSRDATHPPVRLVHCWDARQPLLGWVLSAQCDPPCRFAVHRRCAHVARRLGYGGVDIGFITAAAHTDGGGQGTAAAGLRDDMALEALARDRDLVVLAWGTAVDAGCGAAAARLLHRELACHAGSLAVLGWTAHGQPLDVVDAGRAPALTCLRCASRDSYDHDYRFDRLVMGVAS